MSLFNAFHMGDHVLISADTEAVFEDGSRSNVSKMLTIPHANAVIAVRGSMAVLTEAHSQFASLSDFDEMLKFADVVIQYALAKHGDNDLGEFGKGVEMILAGYSKQAGKLTINLFRCKALGDDVEEHLDLQNVICPGDLNITLEGVSASKAGLVVLTGRQVKAIRDSAPECAAGGNLVIAEIRPRSILLEHLGAL